LPSPATLSLTLLTVKIIAEAGSGQLSVYGCSWQSDDDQPPRAEAFGRPNAHWLRFTTHTHTHTRRHTHKSNEHISRHQAFHNTHTVGDFIPPPQRND